MKNQPRVEILAVGMMTSLGLTAPRTAAAVRGGIDRFQSSEYIDLRGAPITMALVPEAEMPPLDLFFSNEEQTDEDFKLPPDGRIRRPPPLTHRETRMLRIAGAAFGECLARERRIEPVPLFLATPEQLPDLPPPIGPDFLEHLATQTGIPFDTKRSRLLPRGRAGGLVALREALDRLPLLADGRVIVGGVDSPRDADWLDKLDEDDRIRSSEALDGFIPGEGAVFLVLGSPGTAKREKRSPLAFIDGVGLGQEKGHRYSEEVYRGDGLDAAFRALFTATPPPAPVRTVYAGLNGEHFNTKEWGVSFIRHSERFIEGFRLEHPADCLGDLGAALAPALLALAAIGLEQGYRKSPCLVWASSDLEDRGAALLSSGATP